MNSNKSLFFILVICFVSALAGGLITFRSFHLSERVQNPFHMEPNMTPTKKIESNSQIISLLKHIDESSLCGIIYNVRVSQTSGDAKLALDCQTKKWINLENSLQGSNQYPFAPYGVKKFALIKKENTWTVYTEEKNGENKLDELVSAIPIVSNEVLRIFPELKKIETERVKNNELQMKIQNSRREDVKNSF